VCISINWLIDWLLSNLYIDTKLSSASCRDYKILSPTNKVLNLHIILYNLISVQPPHSTRSSDVVTLSCPSSSSSLKVNNSSFRHASPCLWHDGIRTYHPCLCFRFKCRWRKSIVRIYSNIHFASQVAVKQWSLLGGKGLSFPLGVIVDWIQRLVWQPTALRFSC